MNLRTLISFTSSAILEDEGRDSGLQVAGKIER